MRIADILRDKGADVTTVARKATMSETIAVLAGQRIGAIPVSDDGKTLQGIVSERDVVRALATRNGTAFDTMLVDELMTSTVHTCSPDSTLSEVMTLMTDRRIRHVPVVEGKTLVGILSMRDLVGARLREAEVERQQMADYIANRTFN